MITRRLFQTCMEIHIRLGYGVNLCRYTSGLKKLNLSLMMEKRVQVHQADTVEVMASDGNTTATAVPTIDPDAAEAD